MKVLFSLMLVISFFNGFTQTRQQLNNLTAFNKLYGYIQYFHPSDEASKIEWQSFAIYGAKKMLEVKDDQELISVLNGLFLPIAPTIKISEKENLTFDINDITPKNLDGYAPIYWQHIGLKLPYYNNIYNSIRVNRFNPISEERIKKDAFTLLSPVDVAAFKGKKFILTIRVNTDVSGLVLKPYQDKLTLIKDSVALNNEKIYSFEGIFDPKSALFTIAIQSNISSGSININKFILKVLDSGKETNIPVVKKFMALSELDSDIDSRIIRFFKKQGDEKLFGKEPKIGEYIIKSLVRRISCIVPLVVYGNGNNTFPIVGTDDLNKIINRSYESWPKDKNGEFKINGSDLSIRLADLIILFNALKHSYPYWDDASQRHDQIWNAAIQRAFSDKTDQDFLKTLKWIGNLLNDGHMFIDIYGDTDKNTATLPLLFDIAEGKVVVKKVLDSLLNQKIKAGDELIQIDGENPFALIRSAALLYSGSKQWKQSKSILSFTKGKKDEVSHLKIKRGRQFLVFDVSRTNPYSEYVAGSDRNNRGGSEWITSDIFYINLNKTTTDLHMAEILKAKSVIIDMRGYLNEDAETFLSHLTDKKLHANSGMFTPQILYPDYQNVSYAVGSYEILPVLPLIKAKIFLLSDATGQSATESFLSAYKQFKAAKIIGQPTSGTNGNINLISMPGGYRFFYSGILFKNPDGSKHHLNGVIPDVTVKNTISGIRSGKDEILEEAIKVAKEN